MYRKFVYSNEFIQNSLEAHLVFARVVKEHAYILQAALGTMNPEVGKAFSGFVQTFERDLRAAIALAGGRLPAEILNAEEITTPFTLDAENRTMFFTNIPIDTSITLAERDLAPSRGEVTYDEKVAENVSQLNYNVLQHLTDFMAYQQRILNDTNNCFTLYFPSFLQHFMEEEQVYAHVINNLQSNLEMYPDKKECLMYWNTACGQHATYMITQLDPSETELINIAMQFAKYYEDIIALLQQQHGADYQMIIANSSYITKNFAAFQRELIIRMLDCKVYTVATPIMSDHAFREANYFARLLNQMGAGV